MFCIARRYEVWSNVRNAIATTGLVHWHARIQIALCRTWRRPSVRRSWTPFDSSRRPTPICTVFKSVNEIQINETLYRLPIRLSRRMKVDRLSAGMRYGNEGGGGALELEASISETFVFWPTVSSIPANTIPTMWISAANTSNALWNRRRRKPRQW